MTKTYRPLAHECPNCGKTHTCWTKACWYCKAHGYKDDLWFESPQRERAFYKIQNQIRGKEARLMDLGINPNHILGSLADKILKTTDSKKLKGLIARYKQNKLLVKSSVDSTYSLNESGCEYKQRGIA